MRDGVFTNLIYEAQGATLVTPAREGLLVGVPQRVIKDKYLQAWETGTNDSVDATVANFLKTNAGDKIVAGTDLKVYIRKAGEALSAAVQMVGANGFTTVPTISSSNYNDDGVASIVFTAACGLREIGADYYDAGAARVILNNALAVVTVTGTSGAAWLALLEVGMTLFDGVADYTKILSIDLSAGTFTCSGTPAALDDATARVYYDYEGDSISENRAPLITFDIVAQRSAISGMYTITGIEDLIEYFDESSLSYSESNLAFGAFLYMAANGSVDTFRIYAIPVDGTVATATILAANATWLLAINKTVAVESIYHVIPLTNNETILDTFKAHVVAMSTTEQKKERRLYISEKIVNSGDGNAIYTVGDGLTISTNVAAIDGLSTVITLSGSTHGVIAGAKFTGTFGGTIITANVTSVNLAAITVDISCDSDVGSITLWSFYWPQTSGFINSGFDAATDVGVAVTVPSGYASERVTLIGPYYASMGTTDLVGYYIAAIVAGYRASLALGYVTTLDAVPLIDFIPMIDYFTVAQMELIKEAGWYMFNQEMTGAPVKCYHQNTTDQELLEKKEESMVIIIDALAQAVRATLQPYIARGINNRISPTVPESAVNLRYIAKLNSALAAIKHYYITQLEALADFKVIGITPNVANSDQTDIKLEVSHYYPSNRLNVTIYIV